MTHIYKDAPLLPQNEDWIVLSWPHPDWMLYVYCKLVLLTKGGYTPAGEYGGASIVSRSSSRIDEIPPEVEMEFRSVMLEHEFSFEEMCVSDVSDCPPNKGISP